MKKVHDNIDQMLPYGELLRGFSTQSSISKGELKKVLRSRGVFFKDNEKESMVPCISTMLLSPGEFEILKECQNTREDNPKKSSSRIALETNVELIDVVPTVEDLQNVILPDFVNYKLTKAPEITFDKKNTNRMFINYELERYDLNKSWFETKNTFAGNLIVEKTTSNELSITKSYTSEESEEVANKFQNFLIQHYKKVGVVNAESELKKILFKDFTNEQRILFFWKLTSKMDGIYFEFVDIEDVEFRPDESHNLPEKIDWMAKKKELILKGSDIHNTFFMREVDYYPFLQFWGLEAKFKFDYFNTKGTCIAHFLFKDFALKQEQAEFEINISTLTPELMTLAQKQKIELRQKLLELLEERKNQLYKSFLSTIDKAVENV